MLEANLTSTVTLCFERLLMTNTKLYYELPIESWYTLINYVYYNWEIL